MAAVEMSLVEPTRSPCVGRWRQEIQEFKAILSDMGRLPPVREGVHWEMSVSQPVLLKQQGEGRRVVSARPVWQVS